MIHTASLMHDDVVDESPVRRGTSLMGSTCLYETALGAA